MNPTDVPVERKLRPGRFSAARAIRGGRVASTYPSVTNMPNSNLVRNQLKRAFGIESMEAWRAFANELGADRPEVADQLVAFVTMVDEAYVEQDRDLQRRSAQLDASSRDLTEAYERLRVDTHELVAAVLSLRSTAGALARSAGISDFSSERDSLKAMTQIMAELADARVSAVEAMRASEQRLQVAVNTSGIGVWDYDFATNKAYRSAAFHRMLGFEEGELGDSPTALQRYMSAEDYASIQATLAAHVADPSVPFIVHSQMRTKDGRKLWIQGRGQIERDASGTPLRLVGANIDVTPLHEAAETMRSAKEAAETANRAKSDFLANMSHEIRTPMNGVLGLTELCLDTKLNDDQRDYLSMIHTSALSLMTIINDILDFSKIEAGKLILDPSSFSLREVVNESMRTLAVPAHEKGLELALSIDASVPDHVIADSTRLRQVLLNLVGNAVKFTEQGEVEVSISVVETYGSDIRLEVVVIDSGIGIPSHKLEDIFESFTQADTSTTRRFGGTGLGLAICNRLVALLGGSLRVKSTVGEGSAFTFDFCCATSSEPLGTKTRWSAAKLVGLPVLVVDDNATNRRILRDILRNWGMRPELAAGGAEALEILRTARQKGDAFALLLLDAQMPDLDGFALAKQILRESLMPRATIMMLSSIGLGVERARLNKLGIAQALTKPIAQDDLLVSILEALGAKKDAAHADTMMLTPPRRTRALRVLLAEDNTINQKLAIRLLAKLGHTTVVVENGKEAVERFLDDKFDVIFMDVQMPTMGGFEATARIRELEKEFGTHLPIIAMTAHALQGDRERCLQAGMDEYVAKPIVFSDMMRAIEEAMRSPAPKVHEVTMHPPATIEVFDYPTALARMGDDVELFRELAELFIPRVDRYINAMRSANTANTPDVCSDVAHTYRGAVSNFGAPRVVAVLHAVELRARAGTLAANDPLIDQVAEETARFIEALREVLGA